MATAKTRMSQLDKVVRHLKMFETITPMEALKDYGIMRLGARIWEARKVGYDIMTEMVPDTNRFGEPVHYAKYILRGEANGQL